MRSKYQGPPGAFLGLLLLFAYALLLELTGVI